MKRLPNEIPAATDDIRGAEDHHARYYKVQPSRDSATINSDGRVDVRNLIGILGTYAVVNVPETNRIKYVRVATNVLHELMDC